LRGPNARRAVAFVLVFFMAAYFASDTGRLAFGHEWV